MSFDLQNRIIYQDDYLLILNKPSRLLVLPDGYDPLKPNLKQILENEFSKIYIIHRLDKDTSGIIMFAFDQNTHRTLNNQFQRQQVNKKYISISKNIPEWKLLSFKNLIKVNGDRRHRTIVSPNGKPSHTDFYLLKASQSKNLSVIVSSLHTGYTHQIRCHLSYLGFPILGDPLYKNFKNPKQPVTTHLINRTALHANQLTFFHPVQKKRIQLIAPLPDDMQEIIENI